MGEQYRSVLFVTDETQKKEAQSYIEKLTNDEVFRKPIVTAIENASEFYEAEEYHQDYYDRNTEAGYCSFVISPKVAKLRKEFAHLLKENDPE